MNRLAQDKFHFKKIIQYFLQGLIIIAPVSITIWAIYNIVNSIDKWLPISFFSVAIKDFQGNTIGFEHRNYGLGFIIILAVVILVGYFSSFFIQSRIFHLFDKWMENTPGIKFIYSSVRDFFGAFAGEKKKFDKPILAEVFGNNVWVMGFITDEELLKFNLGAEMVSIYIPIGYSWTGQLYIVPRSKIKLLDVSPGDIMKYAISAGVVDVEEDDKKIDLGK